MKESLESALRAVGCPADTARTLVEEARIEPAPAASDAELLLLLGTGVGVDLQDQPEHWEQAVWSLAQNVAADNAEAHDRAARGEPGVTPLWELPGRRPRS